MKIQVSAKSIFEVGQRSNQEDYLYPAMSDQPLTGDLFILCDGMGGHEKGEVASQTVCQVMSSYIGQHRREDGFFDEADFKNALSAAYDALDAKDTSAEKKMGTTLTFVKFHKGGCFIAHIGDSRIYQIRPATKSILHKTRDHSLVNDLISLGELTPEEARTSKQKNIITRAMQPHQDRRAQADCVNLTDLKAGDYFYMCSDGMLEISEDSEIVNILSMDRSDAEKIEILRSVTRENRDNHSAHLIRIVSVENDPDKAVVPPVAPPKPTPTAPPTPPVTPPTPAPAAASTTPPTTRPAAPAATAPKVAPVTASAPARRSSPLPRIIPMLLGLVFLAAITYGMVCMLKKTRDKEEVTPPVTTTTTVPDNPRPQPQPQRPTNHNPTQSASQTQNHNQIQTENTPVVPTPQEPQAPQQTIEDASPSSDPDPNVSAGPNVADIEADVEAETATLMISSYPLGASIYIDGADTGYKTFKLIEGLSISIHKVELKKEGYKTLTEYVDLAKKKNLNLTLEPITDGQDNE